MAPQPPNDRPKPSLLQVVPTWSRQSTHPPRMDVPYEEVGQNSPDSEPSMPSPLSPRLEGPGSGTGDSPATNRDEEDLSRPSENQDSPEAPEVLSFPEPPPLGGPLRDFWDSDGTRNEADGTGDEDEVDTLQRAADSAALDSDCELIELGDASEDELVGHSTTSTSNNKLTDGQARMTVQQQPKSKPTRKGPGSLFRKMLTKRSKKDKEDDGDEDGTGPHGRTSTGAKVVLTGGPYPTRDRHK